MNGKITGMLSLSGMMLATSFTFGEISSAPNTIFQELSPERYAWIQTLDFRQRRLIKELLENAERNPQGRGDLASMIRALEQYSALLGRLADPDAQTLLDASFLPTFFSAPPWKLTPEQVPGLLRVLKEYQVSLNAKIPPAQQEADDAIWRLMEWIREFSIEREGVVEILQIAEAYAAGQPLDEGNVYTKFFRKKPSVALVQKLIDVAKTHLAQTGSVAPDDEHTAPVANSDDLVQWVMDKTKDPKMTAADITSRIQDLEACIAFLESGQTMSEDNFWAKRQELPSLARLQELLRFLQKHLAALETTKHDSLPPVPEPEDTTVVDDTHEDSVRFGPPISVTMRKKRDKVLAQENIRCWQIIHEDYVNKVADVFSDYITTHPNSSIEARLKRWRSQVITILNQANKLLKETQTLLAYEENKLAEQQERILDLELHIKGYEHDAKVSGSQSTVRKNLMRAKNALLQEKNKRIDRQNCIRLMRAQIREYEHYINVWDPEVKRRWRDIQGKIEDVSDVTLETFAHEHLIDVTIE